MLLLCREAFAPTEGDGGVRCSSMTGGVEEPDARGEGMGEREGPNEGGRGRKRQNDKGGRKEG